MIHHKRDGRRTKTIINRLHELFKEKYLTSASVQVSQGQTKRIKIPGSTKVLSTDEFASYMNKILIAHPYLPKPEDKNYMEFIESYFMKLKKFFSIIPQ